MKHYNPELENKILADLTPRRRRTDSGFISFVGDPSDPANPQIEAVESNHLWVDVSDIENIGYEASTANTALVYAAKIWGGTGTGWTDRNTSPWWKQTGDGERKNFGSGGYYEHGRASGYVVRNNQGTVADLSTLDDIPGTTTQQTITTTTDVTATPFAFNPVSYTFNGRSSTSYFKSLSPVAFDYDIDNPRDDDFIFDNTNGRSYIPRASITITVFDDNRIQSVFAAPIVAFSEIYDAPVDMYSYEFQTAEPILIGKQYSTPSINDNNLYIYEPETANRPANSNLNNRYPASVTTVGDSIVDGGIYHFGYAPEDTLTYWFQNEKAILSGDALDQTEGITWFDFKNYIADDPTTGKNISSGILPGVSSVYFGDRESEVTVMEVVTGTGVGVYSDLKVSKSASNPPIGGKIYAQGNIVSEEAIISDTLRVGGGALSVVGAETRTIQLDSSLLTATSSATSGILNFTGTRGAPTVPSSLDTQMLFEEKADEGTYHFTAYSISGADITIEGVFRVDSDSIDFDHIYSSLNSGTQIFAVLFGNNVDRVTDVALANLNNDPRNDGDRFNPDTLFSFGENDYEILTKDYFDGLASSSFYITVANGGNDVLIGEDLHIGGSLTVGGDFCAPYVINESYEENTSTNRDVLETCKVNYLVDIPDNDSDRSFDLPEGIRGDWIKLVIRTTVAEGAPNSGTRSYTLHPYDDGTTRQFVEGHNDSMNNPIRLVLPAKNYSLELAYINETIGWAVISVS